MQDDGKCRHEPDTQKAAEQVIEREDRYVWILLHEPGKLYISEYSPWRSDISMMQWLRVLLHTLSPRDHGETMCATRCWAQHPLARGRCAHVLWKGLGARGVLSGRECRRFLLAPRMHASVLLLMFVVP